MIGANCAGFLKEKELSGWRHKFFMSLREVCSSIMSPLFFFFFLFVFVFFFVTFFLFLFCSFSFPPTFGIQSIISHLYLLFMKTISFIIFSQFIPLSSRLFLNLAPYNSTICKLTHVVGAHLQSFLSSHEQTDHTSRLVLEQLQFSRAPFFPLQSGITFTPAEHLCATRIKKGVGTELSLLIRWASFFSLSLSYSHCILTLFSPSIYSFRISSSSCSPVAISTGASFTMGS